MGQPLILSLTLEEKKMYGDGQPIFLLKVSLSSIETVVASINERISLTSRFC